MGTFESVLLMVNVGVRPKALTTAVVVCDDGADAGVSPHGRSPISFDRLDRSFLARRPRAVLLVDGVADERQERSYRAS